MPSIAAHMVCAKLVSDKLNIKSPDFIKGNILPDIIDLDKEESHKKIKGKYYLIPDTDYIAQKLNLEDPLQLGYLTHLLLDKYFLEEYLSNFPNKEKIFEDKLIYKDYDIINKKLIEKFHLNLEYLNQVLKDFNVPIDEHSYQTNLKCLNNNISQGKLTYLNTDDFSEFLIESSEKIIKYIKEVKR